MSSLRCALNASSSRWGEDYMQDLEGSLQDITTSSPWFEQVDYDYIQVSPLSLEGVYDLKLSPIPDSAFFESEPQIEAPNMAYKKPHNSLYPIGKLTPEQRRQKILNYLEKKKRRNFNKKHNYNSRKQVAQRRTRVNGRFVTKKQSS